MLFKGYVPTKNKKCLVPFKNKSSAELNTYEEVKDLPEYAGILADDVILIDIDDKTQSEIMFRIVDDLQLRCRVYQTTKGMHFLFKNDMVERCKIKTKIACGMDKIDIKVGCKNSYSILKYDGKERGILYDILEDEEYENVPKWMTPIRSKIDFYELGEGEGRNQALFNYILTLQSAKFTVEEARECIRIINKYILPDRLEDDELETILRDEAFNKPMFFDGKTFLFDEFSTYLKNNRHIVKINGQLHIYKDGIYVDGTDEIESEMIKSIPNLNRQKRSEVLSYLGLICEKVEPSPANYIAFKNGIYDITNDEMREFTPDIVITNKIEYDYNPSAYSELADKTLNKLACNDKDVRALLEEAVGYCFYRRNELRKCFILTGDKQNGKSTYLAMVEQLLGQRNIASLDLKELGDRFKTAELVNKLANIGDDIGDEFIANPAVFKKLVSGNPLTVERKGEKPFSFGNFSKFLFSANDIPRIKDKSGAVMSRLIIIPFDARFTKDDPDFDPYIKYKLIQDEPMQYLINVGIQGLKRVLANQQFTESKRVENQLEEYEENNNPILLFFKEIDFETDILNEPSGDVYMKYREFCIENNFTPMSKIEFSKRLNKQFGCKTVQKKINGKRYMVFVKEE